MNISTAFLNLYPHTAHVGYTNSHDDHERTVDAEDRLALELTPNADEDTDESFDLYKNADYLNLDKGRDFLLEANGASVPLFLFQTLTLS
jgi:hypothetical protein